MRRVGSWRSVRSGLESAYPAGLDVFRTPSLSESQLTMFEDFRRALMTGDTKKLDLLMGAAARAGQPPHLLRDAVDNTLLHVAADNGRVREWLDTMALVRETDVGVTTDMMAARNRLGRTALHVAAAQGDTDGVPLLIEVGADVNALDNLKLTPLDYAQVHAPEDVMQRLHAAGARTGDALAERPLPPDLMPTIVEAMYNVGSDEWKRLIQEAIAEQMPVERLRYRGGHLLHLAAEEGLADQCLKVLGPERATALVNEPNDHGEMPLHLAAFWGHPPSVQALIDAGADVHALGRDHASAMHYAARHNCHDAAVLLIGAGAPCELVNAEGLTPLALAMKSQHHHMARLLRDALAQPMAPLAADGRATVPAEAPAPAAMAMQTSPRHWQQVLQDAPSATARAGSVSPRSVQSPSPMS